MKKFTQQQLVVFLVGFLVLGLFGGVVGGWFVRGAQAEVQVDEGRALLLIGVDEDGSGVRDDVDVMIDDKFAGQLVNTARAYARALGSRMISVNASDAARTEQDFAVAQVCLKEILPVGWQVIAANIHDQVVDTRERIQATSAYFDMLGQSKIVVSPVKPDCSTLL